MNENHDIHDYILSAQREIQSEYDRIQKRAQEDPGTAGDQGEENWATLLRNWLPSYFQVVTKGRVLCENNFASPQVDVLVLHPSYPRILIDKKLYLAGGVAAAFECKTTLKSSHICRALETSAAIRQNMRPNSGTPYRELNSPLIYGMLTHSHSWKNKNSTPIKNVSNAIVECDREFVTHPIQSLDFLTVADLGTWQILKHTCLPHLNTAMSVYLASASDNSADEDPNIGKSLSPIADLLLGLFSKLSWTYVDMRPMQLYFQRVLRSSGGGAMRDWPLAIYSEETRNGIVAGRVNQNEVPSKNFNEWSGHF